MRKITNREYIERKQKNKAVKRTKNSYWTMEE
jgi:hypothetical protein|nr:MAG TPA: hypothetical protein [Caudoviricetes sp.]